MSLFTDRDFVTFDDLTAIDFDVANVAAVEEIPTTFIHTAIEEAASILTANFQSFGPSYGVDYGPGYYSTANLFLPPWSCGNSNPKARMTLGQVVVEGLTAYGSALKRWVSYLALRNFYEQASNRRSEDKYALKVVAIQKDIDNKYWPALKAAGLPVVNVPIPCPGALFELGQGTFTANNVMAMSGGSVAGSTWDVAVTWLNIFGTESGPSETISTALIDNELLTVSIAGLNPPLNVTKWNLYAGPQNATLTLQGTFATSTLSYSFPDAPTGTGAAMGPGQKADQNLLFINLFSRI